MLHVSKYTSTFQSQFSKSQLFWVLFCPVPSHEFLCIFKERKGSDILTANLNGIYNNVYSAIILLLYYYTHSHCNSVIYIVHTNTMCISYMQSCSKCHNLYVPVFAVIQGILSPTHLELSRLYCK